MPTLRALVRYFKIAKGREKRKLAWKVVKEAARYSRTEPYWDFLKKNFDVRERDIKEAMLFLEEIGELEIMRSLDGRRLYVSTLKDIRENPVKLDRWLKLTSKR